MWFLTMPTSDAQEGRDQALRAKRDAGIGVLEGPTDSDENPWEEHKDVFGYDAEDTADSWWVEWGALRERARGVQVSYGATPLHVAAVVSED
jgi:salicylate hydroxylase